MQRVQWMQMEDEDVQNSRCPLLREQDHERYPEGGRWIC